MWQPIAVKTADYLFLGPDNGVLSLALAREQVRQIRRMENTACFRRPVSHIFHGCDIFAPVAARKLGLRRGDVVTLRRSLRRKRAGFIRS